MTQLYRTHENGDKVTHDVDGMTTLYVQEDWPSAKIIAGLGDRK